MLCEKHVRVAAQIRRRICAERLTNQAGHGNRTRARAAAGEQQGAEVTCQSTSLWSLITSQHTTRSTLHWDLADRHTSISAAPRRVDHPPDGEWHEERSR